MNGHHPSASGNLRESTNGSSGAWEVPSTPPEAINVAANRDIKTMSIVIVGSGVGGLCMAAKLREAGAENIEIIEKGDSVGGTWRENRYPGIACDVPTHHYSFTFFRNPGWSQTLAGGPEIKAYLEKMARKLDLKRYLRFNTEVTAAAYQPDGSWEVETNDGRTTKADVLIMATGFLHVPRYPTIEGLEDFGGEVVHSARWDDDLRLEGKRVALIGVGSTGSQIVAATVDKVEHLDVYQRSPQWVAPLDNEKYPAWKRLLWRMFPFLMRRKYDEAMKLFAEGFGLASIGNVELLKMFDDMCKANLATVKDPELRRKLTPDYPVLCKRLVLSSAFYPAIQSPNCELITDSIQRVETNGIRTADGELREADVIILATGYVSDAYFRSIAITGLDGLKLTDAWKEGTRSFQTVSLAGFPNLFMVGGPFTPTGQLANPVVAETQVGHIVRLIQSLQRERAVALVPKPEAQDAFVKHIRAGEASTIWKTGCTTWFEDRHGHIHVWTDTPQEFLRIMNDGPDLSNYQFVHRDKVGVG